MNVRSTLVRAALLLATLTSVYAQEPKAELNALVERIQTKLKAGQRSAAALAPELAEFDQLAAKYKDRKSESAAEISALRASLYLSVLGDEAKGRELLAQIKKDFPGTKAAADANRLLSVQEQRARAQLEKQALVGKRAPELNFTWSTIPGVKHLSDLKGKVVVLDFWATWCGPCIASFPEVRKLVEHYRGTDVVVVGVTSLQGRVVNLEPTPINTRDDPDKEYSLMPAFMKAKGMTWAVVFSSEAVFNGDYAVTGIPHMTIIAPDGTVRHNGIHPASPHAGKVEKIDAILKEFKLATPGKA